MSIVRAIAQAVRNAMANEARRTSAFETMKVTAFDASTGAMNVKPGGAQAGYTGIANATVNRLSGVDVGQSVLTLKIGADHGSVSRFVRSPYQEGTETTHVI